MIAIADMKCNRCRRYSRQNGCEYETRQYKKYCDCVLGKNDSSDLIPVQQSNDDGSITVHLPDELPTLAEIMEANRRKASK